MPSINLYVLHATGVEGCTTACDSSSSRWTRCEACSVSMCSCCVCPRAPVVLTTPACRRASRLIAKTRLKRRVCDDTTGFKVVIAMPEYNKRAAAAAAAAKAEAAAKAKEEAAARAEQEAMEQAAREAEVSAAPVHPYMF